MNRANRRSWRVAQAIDTMPLCSVRTGAQRFFYGVFAWEPGEKRTTEQAGERANRRRKDEPEAQITFKFPPRPNRDNLFVIQK